ncbi:MAG: hypothetical protein IJ071_07140 [Ruminococcus sp.]|nr:hypothetical protein [Ruminococcus sp.]
MFGKARANGIRPYNLFPEIGREAEGGLPYRVFVNHGRPMAVPTMH